MKILQHCSTCICSTLLTLTYMYTRDAYCALNAFICLAIYTSPKWLNEESICPVCERSSSALQGLNPVGEFKGAFLWDDLDQDQ